MGNVHFQSNRHDWETPPELFKKINLEFGFDLDVCATHENAKCERYFTPDDDGLSQDWDGICWMNPPFGREIIKWMAKAYHESQKGSTVVCFVPARTDTEWWHEYAMKGEIRFIRGRIRFVGAPDRAPFPSVLVIFRGNNEP